MTSLRRVIKTFLPLSLHLPFPPLPSLSHLLLLLSPYTIPFPRGLVRNSPPHLSHPLSGLEAPSQLLQSHGHLSQAWKRLLSLPNLMVSRILSSPGLVSSSQPQLFLEDYSQSSSQPQQFLEDSPSWSTAPGPGSGSPTWSTAPPQKSLLIPLPALFHLLNSNPFLHVSWLVSTILKIFKARVEALDDLVTLRGSRNYQKDSTVSQLPDGSSVKFEYEWFKLRIDQIGLDSVKYFLHGLRHGNLHEAMITDPSLQLVKVSSNHLSEAILAYSEIPPNRRFQVTKKISDSLADQFTRLQSHY